ncbi:MAG TPA: ribosome biogenesis factor YjgA [Kofleriaceae bacterium]|nr:ribosome biogenesis factor YjgA [Kofleriaceae bacterium]
MDDPRQSRRQLARGERRRAGERSADLARALMKLGDAAIPKLEVGERLRAAIDRARRVTAPGARRRAERELAGTLRGEDMADLAARLERVKTTGAGDSRHLHVAERWRETMIAGGVAAAGFPGGVDEELPQLIARAQGERATGKPPGAARALFRHLAAILKAQAAAERDEDEDDAGDDAEAEEGDEAAGDDAADEVAADDDDADDGDDADDADDAAS